MRNLRSFAISSVLALVGSMLPLSHALANISAPANVSVVSTSALNTGVTSASAKVEWSSVSGAVAYSVQATFDSQVIFGSAAVCQNNNCVSFIDGLSGGETYAVRVSAISASGVAAAAAAVSHRAISIPGSPGTLQSRGGNGVVSLVWSEPTNLGGLPLTGYVIVDQDDRETAVSQTATSATLSNLTNGVSYNFRIAATTANGQSRLVSFPAVTPVGFPSSPARPVLTTTSNTVTAQWTAPADGGSPITGHTAVLFLDGNQVSNRVLAAGVNLASFTELSAGTYTVRVLATNAIGSSELSVASLPSAIGVVRQAQVITFGQIASQTAPGSVALNANSDSGAEVTFRVTGNCSLDLTSTTVTFATAGTCTVVASALGSDAFLPAQPVTRSFSITAAATTTSPPPVSPPIGGSGGGSPRPTVTPTESAAAGGGGGGGTPDLVISSITTTSALVSNSAQVVIRGSNLTPVFRVLLGSVTGSFAVRSDTELVLSFLNPATGSNSLTLFYGDRALRLTVTVVPGTVSPPVAQPPTVSPPVSVIPGTPVQTQAITRATVGSFKGLLAIYIANAQGKRVSIKIAGKWQAVRSVPSNFFRMTRKVGSGFRVSVQVFVDGKLLRSSTIRTR